MGNSVQVFLGVWAAVSAVTTAIFLGAYFLGKYVHRLEAVEKKVEDHDEIISVWKGAGV